MTLNSMHTRDLHIVDGHAHVGSMKFVPQEFIEGIAANIAASAANVAPALTPARAGDFLIAQHQDHFADELIEHMTQAGVRKAVLLIPDFTATLHCPLTIEEMALRHHEIRQRHPDRFYVFQGVDPRTSRRGVEFFQKVISEYRFNGLKLYPPCGYSPSDPRLFPYYEICSNLALPVLVHTGPTSPVLSFRFSPPSFIDQAARLFPKVSFILAHGGVNNVSEAAALCAYRPNVYLDTGGFLSAIHPRGWKAHLRELFALKISHKIIFGTDWPFGRLAGGYPRVIEQLLGANGPFENSPLQDVKNIMGLTMERLIGN